MEVDDKTAVSNVVVPPPTTPPVVVAAPVLVRTVYTNLIRCTLHRIYYSFGSLHRKHLNMNCYGGSNRYIPTDLRTYTF